jgi:hypothetical protein
MPSVKARRHCTLVIPSTPSTPSASGRINVSNGPRSTISGLSQAAYSASLFRGDLDWETFETDEALQYRVNGAYTTSDDVAPVAGTWDWDVP